MEVVLRGIDYFEKGGFIMYVLLFCSVFVGSIAIERWRYFQQADSGRTFADSYCQALSNGLWQEGFELAKQAKGELAGLICRAMKRRGAESMKIHNFFDIETGVILSKFRRRLYYLSVIVTMAPLLGLLGTIGGMISAFSVFDLKAGEPMAITGGIGEALIATATGLCVAIISLAIHAYFSQRLEQIITDMEQCLSYLEEYSERGAIDEAS
jgi:biopolymer transport protein ExbB